MKNKGFSLIELLSVIVILAVITAIAYPKVTDMIENVRISAYDSAKGNIIESAKIKYMGNINNAKVTEYTVEDLIDSGYLSEATKNPITDKDYEDTKVIITNDNNIVSVEYVSGNTLYDLIKNKNQNDGLYKINDSYVYKGINSNNYISFNKEIYRIIKIDSYRNIYLLKEYNNIVTKDNIDSHITSYYNDNYSEKIKDNIISIDILEYNDYVNSFINSDSYIEINNDIWVKDNEYKVLSSLTNEISNGNSAGLMTVLKLKNTTTIISGDGSQLNPYIVLE